jgi:predicted transporter
VEYQSLILGILFSIGIFAIKSGAGMAYLFSGQKIKTRLLVFFIIGFSYLIVFLAACYVIHRIDPVKHLVRIQQFMQSGMTIHLIMALFMMIWGILLLNHGNRDHHKKSKGWLILTLPCPVCMTVVFISTAFLITLFPQKPVLVTGGLYASFILVNLITVLIISIYRKYRDVDPESFLGGIMLLIAVYFFLSVTVMPNFSDLDKVYRLAMYKGQNKPQEITYLVPFIIITVLAFAGGFSYKIKKIIRSIL